MQPTLSYYLYLAPHKINTTKTTVDQGVDLLANKNYEVTAIQAKFYNANKGMVITNNYFTSPAKELADKTAIILWDRDKLSEIIKLVY